MCCDSASTPALVSPAGVRFPPVMSPQDSVSAVAAPPHPAAPDYTITLFDREGPDAVLGVRSAVWGAVLGTITTGLGIGASLIPPVPPHGVLRSVAAGVVTGVASAVVIRALAEGASRSFLSFVQPGDTCPPEPEYARRDALATRGDMDGALSGYEAIIGTQPGEAVARLRAAELYVLAGDPRRAEALLREVLRHPARTDAHDLRASNRLVDLYLGPLDEPTKALDELRRLADAHAGTAVGDGALEAIAFVTGDPVTATLS